MAEDTRSAPAKLEDSKIYSACAEVEEKERSAGEEEFEQELEREESEMEGADPIEVPASGHPAAAASEAPEAAASEASEAEAPKLRFLTVVQHDGLFVTGAILGGETVMLWSRDGASWRLGYRAAGAEVLSIARSPRTWVAVGSGEPSLLLLSRDGRTWHSAVAPHPRFFPEVVWTGSVFLLRAEALMGGSHLYSSTDGESWAQMDVRNVPIHLTPTPRGIIGAPAPWGPEGGSALALSTDGGASWTSAKLNDMPLGFWWDDGVIRGASVWDCCYGEMPSGNIFYSLESKDGRHWFRTESGEAPRKVVRLGDTSVGISARTSRLIYRKQSDSAWRPSSECVRVEDVAGGKRFVAVSKGRLMHSVDGKNWQEAELPPLGE